MIWSSLIAALAALGGTWVGGYWAAKAQREDHDFRERTWFHDLRMETYARYIALARHVAEQKGNASEDLRSEFFDSFERVGLLAGRNVHHKAAGVHNAAWAAEDAQISSRRDATKAFDLKVADLQRAIRKELGIRRDVTEGAPK